ncbi:hypothetical protein BKA93DRAFT_729885 [Sparassis latifolia]
MLAAAQADKTPHWPSLYSLGVELFPISHRAPTHKDGSYLYNANVVFRFTLYWTLVLYTPAFMLCGIYAFLNIVFPPQRLQRASWRRASFTFPFSSPPTAPTSGDIQLQAYDAIPKKDMPSQYRSRTMLNEKRSRLTFGLLVVLTYGVFALTGAVIGSALIGYVLAGIFTAGDYNMST